MAKVDALSLAFAIRDPEAFARTLNHGMTSEIIDILNNVPAGVATAVASRLPVKRLGELIASGKVDAGEWLTEAVLDDAVKLAGRLPREHSLVLINSLDDAERRNRLLQYLKYPDHSVGAVVSDVLIGMQAGAPATEALAELREFSEEPPGAIVLTESDGSYAGLLDAWALLLAEKPSGQARHYARLVPPLRPETPLVDAAADPNWRNYGWLPVVDYRQRIIGAASRDRVMEHLASQGAATPRRVDFFALLHDMVRVLAALLDRVLFARVRQ